MTGQELISAIYDAASSMPVLVGLYEFDHGVEMVELSAYTPGQGAGTAFMGKLCELADRAERCVYVRPGCPRSKAFYERFGFQRSSMFAILVRPPALTQ